MEGRRKEGWQGVFSPVYGFDFLLAGLNPSGILIHSQPGHQGVVSGYDFPLEVRPLVPDPPHLEVGVHPDVIPKDRLVSFVVKACVSP
jgi:hypothetical protein